jgi:enoyl-CoA hydratase/carnithine racemase
MNTTAKLTNNGNVFLITIDDGKDNRLTIKTLRQIEICLDEVENSLTELENGGALVTTGFGNYFSNGIEIKKWVPQELREFSKLLYSVLSRLLVFPIPTICAINGHAAGAGVDCLDVIIVDLVFVSNPYCLFLFFVSLSC